VDAFTPAPAKTALFEGCSRSIPLQIRHPLVKRLAIWLALLQLPWLFSHGRAKSMQGKIQEDFSPRKGILDLDLAQLKISVAS